MKYYAEFYNEERAEWVREEITREKAVFEIGKYYNNAEECAELPCYYRTMFGGIDVVKE